MINFLVATQFCNGSWQFDGMFENHFDADDYRRLVKFGAHIFAIPDGGGLFWIYEPDREIELTEEERWDLQNHECDRNESWWEHDARGIPLCRVCDKCRKVKLSGYRQDVLENPGYAADEPIEEEW